MVGSTGGKDGCSASKAKVNGVAAVRPRPPASWTVEDVVQWLKRKCGDIGLLYCEAFTQHNIRGRALLLLKPPDLDRMGITNSDHQQRIWREILKLKIKSDILEIRDLTAQVRGNNK